MEFGTKCQECGAAFQDGDQHYGITGTDLDLCEPCQELVIRRRLVQPTTAVNRKPQEGKIMDNKTEKTDKTITTVEKLRREKKAKTPKEPKAPKPPKPPKAPKTAKEPKAKKEKKSKADRQLLKDAALKLLQRANGATVKEVKEATGWTDNHSVHSFVSAVRGGRLPNMKKLKVTEDGEGEARRYIVASE